MGMIQLEPRKRLEFGLILDNDQHPGGQIQVVPHDSHLPVKTGALASCHACARITRAHFPR